MEINLAWSCSGSRQQREGIDVDSFFFRARRLQFVLCAFVSLFASLTTRRNEGHAQKKRKRLERETGTEEEGRVSRGSKHLNPSQGAPPVTNGRNGWRFMEPSAFNLVYRLWVIIWEYNLGKFLGILKTGGEWRKLNIVMLLENLVKNWV